MLKLVYMDEDILCFNIGFGWLAPAQQKIIRKKLVNNSYSDTALDVGVKLVRNSNNDPIITRGGLLVRLYGDIDWTTMGDQDDNFSIGDIGPYESKILEFMVKVPEGLSNSERRRYDIQLSIYYL